MANSYDYTYTSTNRYVANVQSIQFIRKSNIVIDVTGARPNTLLHVFFDSVNVDQFCGPTTLTGTAVVYATVPSSVTLNTPIVSDANGNALIFFSIPAQTFTTGNKGVIVTEVTDLDLLSINGNTFGSCQATYSTNGTLTTYQRVTTTNNVHVDIVERTVQWQRQDPLAQSFFTYGIKGGLFVTAIELFFSTKDNNIPIQVELRGMNNGFPMELDRTNPDLVSVLSPSQVNVNTVAAIKAGTGVGTKFHFNPPVYLKEDSDFAFVVFTNSNKYNIFTSKMGEASYETGHNIMEQPYIGSMFKSENNYTWTPEQTEDIKFNLYKANFGTGSASPVFVAGQIPVSVSGTKFYTTSGSPSIIYKSDYAHAFDVGDQITIGANTSVGVYNGIPGISLTGTFAITSIIDDHTVTFNAGANATSTGQIVNCGFLRNVAIVNGGLGYTTAPTITVSGGGSPTIAATVTNVVVVNGVVTGMTITPGAGYTSAPTLTISGVGSGLVLSPSIEAQFTVVSNAPYSIIAPQMLAAATGSSTISGVIKSMYGNYSGGSLTSYTFSEDTPFNPLSVVTFNQNRRLASRANEYLRISNQPSLQLTMNMTTDNPNVSPFIDMRTPPKLLLASYKINNQAAVEDLTSANNSGSVSTTGYTISNGGSGYTNGSGTVVVTVVNAANDVTGAGASVVTTVAGGVVTALTITGGAGYTQVPSLVFAPPSSGTTATASVVLTKFNSELGGLNTATNVPVATTAYARYLTKKIGLTTISTDIRVITNIDSSPETSVDIYIRTSLSGNNTIHTNQKWQLLTCPVARNKSGTRGQFYEYTFTGASLQPFDVYDLKFVMSSSNPARTPCVQDYRVIIAV